MNILILTGGESGEREVAMRSGKAIAKALISLGHKIALVDTLRCPNTSEFAFTGEINEALARFERWKSIKPVPPLHPYLFRIAPLASRVFPALHGGIGENGRLASVLECIGVTYSGSKPEALAVTMDKLKSKILYENAAILTPSYTVYSVNSSKKPMPPRYPCVIKPTDSGSSIGISFANDETELTGAIKRAFDVCDTVVLEEKILGREFSVSVLCDEPLAVTEIIPKSTFYDYDSKYINGGAREITPAPLQKELTDRALSISKRAHKALGLSNFSRTDLILKKGTNMFYALETNALPGLTETSILPSAANACGISFPELCRKML